MKENLTRRDVLKTAALGTAGLVATEAKSAIIDLDDGNKLYVRDEDVGEFTEAMKAMTELNKRLEEASKCGDIEAQRKILQEARPWFEKANGVMGRAIRELKNQKP